MLKTASAALLLIAPAAAAAQAPAPEPAPPPAAAQALITRLHMHNIPHEGPWFVQTWKSDDTIDGALSTRWPGPRQLATAIYMVLTHDDFSALHRLTSDEMWHFHGGHPAQLLLLYPDGHGETRIWGSDVAQGQEPQILVPRGTWMGARPLGDVADAWSFGGTTVTPGFEYTDYEPGYRDELVARYPQFAREITALTRPGARPHPAVAAAPPPPIAVEQLVGRDGPQQSLAISTARFVMQPGVTFPPTITREGHEVMIVTAGTGTVTVGSTTQAAKPGAVIYLPPGVPHTIHAERRLEFYVSVAPAWQASDMQAAPAPGPGPARPR